MLNAVGLFRFRVGEGARPSVHRPHTAAKCEKRFPSLPRLLPNKKLLLKRSIKKFQ